MDFAELANWNEYSKLFIGLLAISTPLAAVPIYLSFSSSFQYTDRIRLALSAAVAYASILIVFALFGEAILGVFGISIAAFKVAGGILLFLNGLDLMKSDPSQPDVSSKTSPGSSAISFGIIPLAIPLMAGPGAISSVIIYSHHHESFEHKIVVCAVVVSVALSVYFLLRSALAAGSLLNQTSMLVLSKIMGLILTAIGVEFILDGITEHFPQLISIH